MLFQSIVVATKSFITDFSTLLKKACEVIHGYYYLLTSWKWFSSSFLFTKEVIIKEAVQHLPVSPTLPV
jgi:hypothetical protein